MLHGYVLCTLVLSQAMGSAALPLTTPWSLLRASAHVKLSLRP